MELILGNEFTKSTRYTITVRLSKLDKNVKNKKIFSVHLFYNI